MLSRPWKRIKKASHSLRKLSQNFLEVSVRQALGRPMRKRDVGWVPPGKSAALLSERGKRGRKKTLWQAFGRGSSKDFGNHKEKPCRSTPRETQGERRPRDEYACAFSFWSGACCALWGRPIRIPATPRNPVLTKSRGISHGLRCKASYPRSQKGLFPLLPKPNTPHRTQRDTPSSLREK